MKLKKKKSSYSYILLIFILLISAVVTYYLYTEKKAFIKEPVPLPSVPVVQNVEIEGLLNTTEVTSGNFELQTLKHPPFSTMNHAAKLEHYDAQENFAFNELEKKPFFCLPEGEIRNDTVTFYVGSSRYRNENTKLIFSSSYLLKNIQLPDSVKVQEENLVYCWNETSSEISLNKPDFGIVSWTEENNNKVHNRVMFFNGNEKFQISSGYFKNIVPLYLTSDKFLVVFEAYGGGWDDTEVISFNLKNMTFQNEDNCASLFPRSSRSLSFDQKCNPSLEGNAQDSVSDFGFQRKN